LNIFDRVLQQNQKSRHKIYSLHEPQVACIAKGKQHKKYEFGSKVSLAMTKQSGVLVGVAHFWGNPYDGDTLDKTLDSIRSTTGQLPATIFADRGYRGRNTVQGVTVSLPKAPCKTATAPQKRLARKNFGRRSAIEPVIGHLKSDFRLARNYLKGAVGDVMNLLLAATAFNLRKWMRGLPVCLFFAFLSVLRVNYADCMEMDGVATLA
jgi:Transposase DDE domain.